MFLSVLNVRLGRFDIRFLLITSYVLTLESSASSSLHRDEEDIFRLCHKPQIMQKIQLYLFCFVFDIILFILIQRSFTKQVIKDQVYNKYAKFPSLMPFESTFVTLHISFVYEVAMMIRLVFQEVTVYVGRFLELSMSLVHSSLSSFVYLIFALH